MSHSVTFFYKSPLGGPLEAFWGAQNWADTALLVNIEKLRLMLVVAEQYLLGEHSLNQTNLMKILHI